MDKVERDKVAYDTERYLRRGYKKQGNSVPGMIDMFSGLQNASRLQKAQARAKLVRSRGWQTLREAAYRNSWESRSGLVDHGQRFMRRIQESVIIDLEAFFAQEEGYGHDNRWFYQ